MNKIYVIIQSGNSGGFEDGAEFNLCARFSEEDAKKTVECLKARHEKVKSIHPVITRAYYDALRDKSKNTMDDSSAIEHASMFARKIAVENGANELDLGMLGFYGASSFEPYAFDSNDSFYYEELPIE